MTDKQKRDAAVDAYAAEIKARLDAMAAEGYCGWAGSFPEEALLHSLGSDAGFVQRRDLGAGERRTALVDIGGTAMILWFRSGQAEAAETK